MEAPGKLYIGKNIYGTFMYQLHDPDDETEVEYVREDAFIDKACEWLEENLAKETSVIGNGIVTINFRGAIEAFKKAMEE